MASTIGRSGDNSASVGTSLDLRGFAHGIWNPEDLVRLEGTEWIVVSAMRSVGERGTLFALQAEAAHAALEIPWHPSAEAGRVSRAAFDPHGIDVRAIGDGSHELLVVDHGGGEAIDRLTIIVDANGPTIVSGERIPQPRHTSGNAVAYLPSGGFVMTSMFDPEDRAFLHKFAVGEPTGCVWRWGADEGWEPLGPELSGANGIVTLPDGGVIVSEWAARRLWRLAPDGGVIGSAGVDFLPDNLRWCKDGRLLLAGQIARPEAVFGCEARGEPCPLAYAVSSVDARSLACETLVRRTEVEAKAEGFGGATGALVIGREIWVGSFTGSTIARFSVSQDDGSF